MSKVSVTKDKLDILANAIANKSGEPLTLTLDEMVSAVDGIETGGGGITPTGNIDITQAGVTDVTNYATATVPNAGYASGVSYWYETENNQRKFVTVGQWNGIVSGFIKLDEYQEMLTPERKFNAIPTGTTITPTTSAQTIGGANYMMEGAVTVNAVPTFNGAIDIDAGGFSTVSNQRKWKVRGWVSADVGEDGYIGEGDEYGEYTYYNAVPSGTTITPTESPQTIGDENTMLEGAVTVNAIPSNYVGSGITQRSSTDLTVSGATVTAPSGYYSASASKSVASGSVSAPSAVVASNATVAVNTNTGIVTLQKQNVGNVPVITEGYITQAGNQNSTVQLQGSLTMGTAGTPTATKGTVSNHSVSVTPSVTNTTGYITGGTKTGTAVTVSASELVSGTKSITGNGTGIDVTNYASVDVAVQSGMDVPIFIATYNQSTGVVTVTCNKTYQQCDDLVFIDGEYTAVVTFGDGLYFPLEGFWEDGTKIRYFGTEQGVPAYEIVYNYNGTITFNDSSVLDTLNVTENGTYTPPFGKVYNEVVVNVSGGGSSTISVGKTTRTLASASSSIQFTGLSGNPTSFAVTSSADITTNTNGVTAVVFDGTSLHGQILSTQATADTGFTKSYSGGTLTITATTGTFQANEYKLVYTYGGSTSDIETADIQVGSGATSITFPVTGRPIYWSCIFKSDFSTSSGYQRVIEVVNDGTSTYGMALDSTANALTSWTANYSGGNLTITSQSTNNGGYFHQPGYYQLTYAVDESAPSYQTKTVTPTTLQQIVTPDSGYDALSQVTVNAIPSQYIIPSGNLPITANGNNINVSQYATVSVNVPTGGGDSKNAQTVQQSNTRITATTYTKACGDITVAKTGTYDVYWTSYRTSTSGTWGSQLYINNTAYGTAQTTFTNSYYQAIHLSNVSLTANQTVSVYGRSRGSNYYLYVGQLTIIEA